MVVHEHGRVIAFYSLSPTGVAPNIMPRAIRTGQPPDPVPCILLGQFAVDLAWAGHGIGSGLLKHAYDRSLAAARLAGGRALMVNAIDDDAAQYWRRRGFAPSKDNPHILFRSMADIDLARTKAQL